MQKIFFGLTLPLLMLMVVIFFPSSLYSEEIKKPVTESNKSSGRRTFSIGRPFSKPDKGRKKEKTKFELGGVLMWDYDQFNGVHISRFQEGYQVVNETELRRARIDLTSKFDKDWQVKLQVSFDNEDSATKVGDAYITFSGWKYATLTIGQTKEPFGLEELTGSTCITLVERTMVSSAFAPGHHVGLGISGHQRPFSWAIGVYEAADLENKRDTYALTGRFVFAPWGGGNRVLHIGIAGSVRDFDGEEYEIQESAEVHTAEEIVKSNTIPADEVQLLDTEFAWVRGPFSLQAEYMTAIIKASADDDAAYIGYYLQGSYFFTGESRPYKKGAFKRLKPINTYGALEMVVRYSFLDAEDNRKGVRAENYTIGANYYLNNRARLMINYIKTTLTDGVSGQEGKAEAISSRIQYSF